MSDVIKLNLKNKKIKARLMGSDTEEIAAKANEEEDLFKKELEKYYQKGFSEGYSSAKTELEKEYSDQLVQKSEQFYNILSNFEEKLVEYDESFTEIIVEVSHRIAEKIIKAEIEKNSIIEKTLNESITKILGANDATIKMNPKDYEKIQSEGKDEELSNKFAKIKFDPTESITEGGCLIETEIGKVDGRIETQLNEILKSLQNKLLNSEEE
jgi:flagellar assembly protein FliH